jgi:hypothetical protein
MLIQQLEPSNSSLGRGGGEFFLQSMKNDFNGKGITSIDLVLS